MGIHVRPLCVVPDSMRFKAMPTVNDPTELEQLGLECHMVRHGQSQNQSPFGWFERDQPPPLRKGAHPPIQAIYPSIHPSFQTSTKTYKRTNTQQASQRASNGTKHCQPKTKQANKRKQTNRNRNQAKPNHPSPPNQPNQKQTINTANKPKKEHSLAKHTCERPNSQTSKQTNRNTNSTHAHNNKLERRTYLVETTNPNACLSVHAYLCLPIYLSYLPMFEHLSAHRFLHL